MVLEIGSGLFPNSQNVDIRYEEQITRPILANAEIVLWHIPKSSGENNKNDNTALIINATDDWIAQTFTVGWNGPNTDLTLSAVSFKLHRVLLPGTITCELTAVDSNGHPTGSVLASDTHDGDTITTDTGGEVIKFTFSTAFIIRKDTKYAVYVRTSAADASNTLHVRTESSASYGDFGLDPIGLALTTGNGGSTWNNIVTDCYFDCEVTGDSMLVNIFGTLRQVPLLEVIN